jgi:uncharacterized protein (TIGR00251 family)
MAAGNIKKAGVVLDIRVKPRSRHESLSYDAAGRLTAAITAPPVDGKANEALIALVAKTLGVSRAHCTLVKGQTSRNKSVAIAGITLDDINSKL